MAISNMQQARQLRAGGGIMDLEPRQGFFLGKIAKKITKPLKKVFKSPLGKAALLGGAAYGLGGAKFLGGEGMFTGGQGLGRFSNLLNLVRPAATNTTGKRGLLSGLFYDKAGDFSGKRALLTAGIGATALPFLLGGGEDDEEEITESFSVTPSSITDIVSMARARDPSLRFLPQNAYTQQGFFGAADGGIADLSKPKRGLVDEPGGYAGLNLDSKAKKHLRMVYKQKGANPDGLSFNEWVPLNFEMALGFKDGGRIGYAMGGPTEDVMVENVDTQEVVSAPDPMAELNMLAIELFGKRLDQLNETERGQLQELIQSRMQQQDQQRVMAESGGMIDYMSSANPMADSYIMEDTDIVNMYRPSGDRQMAAEGGIMDLGGMEKDYREEGGFVPIGGQEKADDVPARLSKNEFVFTADAVRNAGGGDIDRGAEVMENLMNNLEQGGEVSEDSQGMNPAQEMFDTAQMLEGRIA
jgi:hypothetical protein